MNGATDNNFAEYDRKFYEFHLLHGAVWKRSEIACIAVVIPISGYSVALVEAKVSFSILLWGLFN